MPLLKSVADVMEAPVAVEHRALFEIISKACADLGRNPADMWKISTSSTWDDYKEVTGKETLPELGHNCKWVFDSKLCDQDKWEKSLMNRYSFGANL